MASAHSLSPAEAAREAMIESQLMPCGVVAAPVVSAFYTVPREAFVAAGRAGLAYVDAAQPIGAGRAMMPALSLGHLLQHVAVARGEATLVIGAGTGYAAALLAHMGAAVTALEADAVLAGRMQEILTDHAITGITVAHGPLAQGWAAHAPYGLMLLDGAIEELPPSLVAQLAEGGRVAAIVRGEDGVMRACQGRMAAGRLRLAPTAEASAPLIPEFRKAERFRF